ncbi:MAG: hypothetical protein KGL39_38105 [Patescibacteria group bacterium]|nr:hypothetical protein [Patescibacteria group bacterium]
MSDHLDAAADKLAGSRASRRAETRTKQLAQSAGRGERVQIKALVSQQTRIRLKIMADLTGESIITLVDGFILDGLQKLENEREKMVRATGRGE